MSSFVFKLVKGQQKKNISLPFSERMLSKCTSIFNFSIHSEKNRRKSYRNKKQQKRGRFLEKGP